jgi:O-antigen/teichoic acid export membrane protein
LNNKRLLFENVFIYGFSNVISKIIPFLFLPIVLFLLDSSSDFAIYTTFITIVGLGTPLVTFGMNDAVFREYFEVEDSEYKKIVLSTSLRFTIFSSFAVFLLFFISSNFISDLFGIDDVRIIYLALLSLIISGFTTILSLPTRLKNERKIFVVMSAIIPLILYGLSLLTLVLGLSYYGLIISSIAANILSLIFYFFINKSHFRFKVFSKEILVKLLKTATPLVPFFLIYWLYNSMDRIMIAQYLSLNDLGIYSVAAKFGSISSILYASFSGGFAHYAYSTIKNDKQVENSSKLFTIVIVFNLVTSVLFYFFAIIFFPLLLPENYLLSTKSSVFLFLSPLLLLAFQISATQFVIQRKSYISLISLLIGLFFNYYFNSLLIPILGIDGASFSTFLSYFVNLLVIYFLASNSKLIIVNIKIVFVIILQFLTAFSLLFFNFSLIGQLINLSTFIIILILFYKDLTKLIRNSPLKF